MSDPLEMTLLGVALISTVIFVTLALLWLCATIIENPHASVALGLMVTICYLVGRFAEVFLW